jgi:ssDNA-binding Zn-finger/Zn-ribbon topoisomerase 1
MKLKAALVSVECPVCGDTEWRFPQRGERAGDVIVDVCPRCAKMYEKREVVKWVS